MTVDYDAPNYLVFLISLLFFTAAFGVMLHFVCLSNHEYYMHCA